MFRTLTLAVHHWLRSERGAALPEFAYLFPVLVAMIMGAYDIGRALTINQKVISSSQIIADLITRNQSITSAELQDIITAGELAIDPYDRTPFGYDIVSIQFDEDGNPEELWRVTGNMEENENAFSRAEGLGEEGEGVVAVSVSYVYEPFFTGFIEEEVRMREAAFLRGRRSAIVTCNDC